MDHAVDETIAHAKDLWSGCVRDETALSTSLTACRPRADPTMARRVLTRPARRLAAQTLAEGADYVLGERIGKGSMGEVFAAEQVCMERTVAVKVLRPELLSDPEATESFLAEALTAAELEHPNTLPVYEIGVTSTGAPFYAMKLVTGSPWSKRLPANSLEDNVGVLLMLCDAVSFAHDKGVIHRDLKPENVMIGPYGEVQLVDWGLAAAVGGGKAQPLSSAAALSGTPAYMPPEVARGDLSQIGKASDVYLLGGILYEIVTGLRPHGGADVYACIAAAARNELQPTDRHGELLDVALTALRTRSEDRFGSVKELQQTIRDYLAHRDSLELTHEARQRLEALPGVPGDELYRECQEIITLYTQALKRWPGNVVAAEGVINTRTTLAGVAVRRGEIMLARSQGKAIDQDLKRYNLSALAPDPVVDQVRAALADQERKRRSADARS
jgi:serine/threonine protein kinase